MSRKNVYLIAAIIWFAISFYLLTIPGKRLPQIGWLDKLHADKLVHITMFFVLSYLFIYPVKKSQNRDFWMITICFAAIIYGIAMEFVQKYFIPFRSFDVNDMIADAVGALAAFFWLKYKFTKQKK